MEKITLHLKYKEPIHINGFVVENDTITFGSVEELNKYINGEAAYDILDDSVIKKITSFCFMQKMKRVM